MNFQAWQQLSPQEAARKIHRGVRSLSSAQQRAVLAWLEPEPVLAENFGAAHPGSSLDRVPYFLKDLFDVAGLPTFAGSTFLPEIRPTPERDSRIVRSLRETGAVFAGKTHLHEFAYGITGENPHYGDCEHPHFPGHTTGGSSSGSAAIVAAGIAPLAIGTDTGGSIRVPAAFCGLYGFRSSPGDALVADAFPLSRTFDTAGWFTANAPDMMHSLNALVQPTQSNRTPRGCYLEWPGVNEDVAAACRVAAARFAAPADQLTVSILRDGFDHAVDTYNQIVAADAWSTHRAWAERYENRYDPAVWQRLQRGATESPSACDDARGKLSEVRAVWANYFKTFDFLIMPATPSGALTKAECTLENRRRLLDLTSPASLGGIPVLTLPVRLPSGLTTGLQVIVQDAQSSVLMWSLASQ